MRIIRRSSLPRVPASHEDPKNPGVLKQVIAKKDDLLAGHVQMVNWATLPAGKSFQSHYHEDMEEIFVLISGTVDVRVDDDYDVLSAGDTLIVSPRSVHTMQNTSDEVVEYLVVGISSGFSGKTVIVQ
jgi:uncharacterized cupin superfamily protein